jgi:hypothetical protein
MIEALLQTVRKKIRFFSQVGFGHSYRSIIPIYSNEIIILLAIFELR